MQLNCKFNLEQIVYLITDVDQSERIITGIQYNKNVLLYCLACGVNESWHYDFEIEVSKKYI